MRWAALVAVAAFGLGACSSTGASEAPSAAAPSVEAPASVEPSVEAPPEGSKDFTVAFTSVGLSSSPFLAAIDKLNEEMGYNITTQELAESELVTAGTAAGDFQFGSGANNATLAAIEKGANLKSLVSRVQNEWTLYARTDITDCAGLDGVRLAIHSQGAVSTAMVRNYIETVCPGTEPEYVVIEGSNNRVAALLADQIDASPLELSDGINIDETASDRYHQIASFAADLPELQTTTIYVNGDWAAENQSSVQALVKAVIEINREIEGDPARLQAIAEQYVPNAINAETIAAAAAKYVELGMFPTDGGLTAENAQYTLDFFGPDGTGSTTVAIPPADFVDLSYLQAALDELGG
jgi:ABC-type nitrate/sulfonate/bicarbonate transport system substrate-binding protein